MDCDPAYTESQELIDRYCPGWTPPTPDGPDNPPGGDGSGIVSPVVWTPGINTPVQPPIHPPGEPGRSVVNVVRDLDGSLVLRGQATDNGTFASLLRAPTRYLPDSVVTERTGWFWAVLFPWLFWLTVGWILYRAFRR